MKGIDNGGPIDQLVTQYHQLHPAPLNAEERKELYVDWVHGEMQMIGNPLTKEQISELYDDLMAKGALWLPGGVPCPPAEPTAQSKR